jgi:hypothetical protein
MGPALVTLYVAVEGLVDGRLVRDPQLNIRIARMPIPIAAVEADARLSSTIARQQRGMAFDRTSSLLFSNRTDRDGFSLSSDSDAARKSERFRPSNC